MSTETRNCQHCGDPVDADLFVVVDGWKRYRCAECIAELERGYIPKLNPSRCGRSQPTLEDTGAWRDIAVRAMEGG